MRFSIVLPVYNRGHLLKFAVQSIIDQTFEDWELHIVDDGSNDHTRKVALECLKIDPRINYHSFTRHQGLVPALNWGNILAQGEIIVKQDSDDLSLPNRLEVIDREMKDSDFFYHGMYQTYDVEKDYLRRSYFPALPIDKERILKEQYIPGAFAYTKKFINETPYRDLHCSEDWMLILDAYLKGHKIGFVNEGLYEYFLREDSNSIINEGTGAYEEDEETMRDILSKEYSIHNFNYAPRT